MKHEKKVHIFIVHSRSYQLHPGCLTSNAQVFRSLAGLKPIELKWDFVFNSFEYLYT